MMANLVGVTGPSCSGKSTVCRALAEQEGIERLSLDNFYKPGGKEGNYDHPDAIKFEEAHKTLQKLKKDKKVTIPEYDKIENIIAGEKTIKPVSIILVDGFMVLNHEGIRSILDKSIFLDIPKQEQLRRRMKRFREGHLDTDEDYFHEQVYPAYKKYIKPTKKHSDHVIDANKEPKKVIEEVQGKIEEM